jgi:mono/diheme cytochrome c family protein
LSLRPVTLAALLALCTAPVLAQKLAPWVTPKEQRERANPVPASDDAHKRGRLLYQRHCAMCHGDKGKGDGPAARLHTERSKRAPKDLTDAKIQASMTDGEIFWKVTTGFKENAQIIMPTFGEEIPREEDRWKLVHYVRSFAPRQ